MANDSFFDELARGLADGTLTRGKALRLMGAALVGGALASLPGVALADDDDCRRFGRRCRRDSQCCSKNCVRRGDDKVCGCPEGQSRCNDRCVNLDRNENHCGSCSNRCAEGQECVGGVCAGGCASDGGACSGDTDCCAEGQQCVSGVCQCPSGTTLCGGSCVPNCPSGRTLDPQSCLCLSICSNPPGAQCDTCTAESDGETFQCYCEPSADGTGSVCRGPLVTNVSSCDECGVFNGINLPVCVQSGAIPGVLYCTTACHGPDGKTCGVPI
jgi:hypothetical protein